MEREPIWDRRDDDKNRPPEFEPDPDTDPLLGVQEHPDQMAEVMAEPEHEAAAWPTHGHAQKSHVVAGLLGIFLGWLGVHRFYLGFTSIGLMQLGLSLACFAIVFLTGLWVGQSVFASLVTALAIDALIALWGLIEGLLILSGQMEHDAHAHPLR